MWDIANLMSMFPKVIILLVLILPVLFLTGCEVPPVDPPAVEQGAASEEADVSSIPVVDTAPIKPESYAPALGEVERLAAVTRIADRSTRVDAQPTIQSDEPPQVWTSKSRQQIHAHFVAVEEPSVVLQLSDHSLIRVPLDHLRHEDAERARALAQP